MKLRGKFSLREITDRKSQRSAPAGVSHTDQYDAEGRVKSSTAITGSGWQYPVYNALGQRVEDYQSDGQGNPMTLTYPIDIFGDRTGTWDQWPSHNWTGWDIYWSRVAGQRLNMGGSSAYIDHSDAVGTTLMETDPAGGVQWDIIRYPWGKPWQETGTRQSVVFAGLDWQLNEPLIPATFRGYNPRIGRWMTPDPTGGDVSNPQSLNRYAYVLNNPASLNDPLGLDGENPADPCSDPSYADSNAECDGPSINFACAVYGICSAGAPGGSFIYHVDGNGDGAPAPPIVPPAGQPPLAGGGATANPWVSNTITASGGNCYGYGGIIPGLPTSSNEPCFLILVTTSATFGGDLPNIPGPGPRIGKSGIVPTHNYWDYVGCVATVLPAKAIGNADAAGITLALHLVPRANPYLWPVATVYDLNIELQTRRECSQEVYGGH